MTDRQVALVTGANKGLGLETARQLLNRGMTVVMGSRDPERGAVAAKRLDAEGRAVPVRLDVTETADVEAAAEMRQNYEVNTFGVVTVIHAMLPLLRNSAAPRIVNVSSTTASMGMTSGGTDFGGDAASRMAYSSSKTALNMLTVQYAHASAKDPELSHIKINSATPGYTATDLTQHRGTRTVEEGARIIVDLSTLTADGPTGGFFNDQGPVPW
ncbi:SDR family NAD(P)-dependent oxidoreductase [Streptomyces sp. NPDC054796]